MTEAKNTEIGEDEIQRYILLIEQCNSTDEKTHSEATNEIEQLISIDIIRSLFILSEIILKDHVECSVACLSLVWIRNIFTPDSQMMSNKDISKEWLEVDETYRTRVKIAIIRGMMLPDHNCALVASMIFCSLLKIEKEQMFDMIPQLYQLYESPDSSELTKEAAINTLAEISSKNSLGSQTDAIEVQTILIQIAEKANFYFSECLDKSLSIRYNIARTIDSLLDSLPPNNIYFTSFVDNCLKNLDNDPKSADLIVQPDQFYSILLSILLKTVKLEYQNDEFHPNTIFEYINQKILDYQGSKDENQIKICFYLYFWTLLADYEREIIKKNKYISKLIAIQQRKQKRGASDYKEEKFRDFCSESIYKLTDKILSIMYMIDPNDLQSEDINIKRPHFYATSCMQSFFKLKSEDVFMRIKEYWQNDMSIYYKAFCSNVIVKPLNWMNDHTLLLTISIFCRKTIIPDVLSPILFSFFNDFFDDDFIILRDYILGTCLHAFEVPKIVDTCLFCISLLYNRYPSFLNEDSLNIILQWTKENMNIADPIIFSRILQLFAVLTHKKIIALLDSNVRLKILESFDLILELFSVAISRPDSNISDIYKNSYAMIRNLVCFNITCTPLFDNSEKIIKLIENQISILDKSSNYEQIKYILSFFNTIFNYPKKFNKELDVFAKQIVDSCLTMANPDSPIFGEILPTLVVIIKNCTSEIDPDLLLKVNDVVNLGLTSPNNSIFLQSIYLHSSIFNGFISNKYPGYENVINSFKSDYEMIVERLNNPSFTNDNYPLLLKAYGMLICSCSDYISNSIPTIVDNFIAQYEQFVNIEISINDDESVEYANTFYIGLFTFGISILKCIKGLDILASNRKIMNLLIHITRMYLKCLEFHFQNNSLLSCFDFIYQFIDTFGKKCNILVNRNCNYTIINHGLISESSLVNNKANETLHILRNA